MQDAAREIPWLSLTWNNPSRLHTQQTYTGTYTFLLSVVHFQLQNNTQSATALQVKDLKYRFGQKTVGREETLVTYNEHLKCYLGSWA